MNPAPRILHGLVALALVAALPAAGHAGTIRGTVELTGGATAHAARPNAYPGRANALAGAKAADMGGVGETIVYVEKLPAGVTVPPPPSERPELEQRGQAFVPRVLAVQVGTTVDFPNRDPIYHNVFSVSPAKRFDLGKYPQGPVAARALRQARPGQRVLRHPLGHGGVRVRRAAPRVRAAGRGDGALRAAGAARRARTRSSAWHPDRGERDAVGAGAQAPATPP